MTKYVLNSGGIKNSPRLKKEFHNELLKSTGDSPIILICSFAQAREYWEGKFEGYCRSISEDFPTHIQPIFLLAMPKDFIKQCEQADIIYFNGGDDHLLQYWIKQYDMSMLFQKKVIATNSASSNMLATHYWTCDWRQCAKGLGILPLKFIPHYKSSFGTNDPRGPIDWEEAYSDLAAYDDTSLPVHALKEGEFIVIEQ